MTNTEYVACLKAQLAAHTLSARAILEGTEDLKRRAQQWESLQGKTPRELLLLAKDIRAMVITHEAASIAL